MRRIHSHIWKRPLQVVAAAVNLKEKMLEQSRTDKILMPQAQGPCALFRLQPLEKQSREMKITLTNKQRFPVGLGLTAVQAGNRTISLDLQRPHFGYGKKSMRPG